MAVPTTRRHAKPCHTMSCAPVIQINNVAPTVVWTRLALKWWGDPARARSRLQKTPLGRFVEPWELANLVVFLCSDACTMCLGQTICVDGGYSVSEPASRTPEDDHAD